MLLKLRIEGKNKEDILNSYLKENELLLSDIYVKEEVEEAKLFKSKKVTLEIYKKEDIQKFIKEYISEVSKNMGLAIQCEIREKEDIFNIMLISDNNPIIIGKDGKNLNSLQLLLHQALNVQTGLNIRINVDASNYKDKKVHRLEREIKEIAREVIHSRIEAKLDSMNSYERRIVHTIVSEYSNLETESFGEAPNRYVVIRYKED